MNSEPLSTYHLTPEEGAGLSLELYRRAASHYEQCERPRNARECWALGGEAGRAADLYLSIKDFQFGVNPPGLKFVSRNLVVIRFAAIQL